MSSKRSIILSGVIAAVIAIALIGGAAFSGILAKPSSTSTTTSSGSGKGTLAVLLTDPPTVPTGTTALYANYSGLAIHISGDGNYSGWIKLNESGTINLMGIVNTTQTIAMANVTDGVFNAIGFNITSAVITYNGQNYTCGIWYQHNKLFVPIPGGIEINGSQTSATVIDMTPTVLLIGDPSNPSFVLMPQAVGYLLPGTSVSHIGLHVGDRDDIDTNPALYWLAHNSQFKITAVTVTNDSMTISVTNTGNASLVFRGVALASTQSTSGGMMSTEDGLPLPSISEYFAVASNGTLIPLTNGTENTMLHEIYSNGDFLSPGQSANFTYSGTISLGVLTAYWHHGYQTQSIVSGQTYVLRVMASGLVAATAVKAS